MLHRMKDGSGIEITKMDNQHLINTIRLLKRRAKEGVTFWYGEAGLYDEPWYDEETYYGDEALEHLNFTSYIEEANKRNLAV